MQELIIRFQKLMTIKYSIRASSWKLMAFNDYHYVEPNDLTIAINAKTKA